MKPLFTVHEGGFLVGDYINRRLGHRFDVWVPTKDSGVDLLVMRKRPRGASAGPQVKFSRGSSIHEEMPRHFIATSWHTPEPKKIRTSRAHRWVFLILTLTPEEPFVVIPTRELRKRIPRGGGRMWNLYLWVFDGGLCYQVRDLGKDENLDLHHRGVRDRHRDYSQRLESWKHLDRLTGKAR